MKRTTASIGQRTTYPRAMRVAVVKSHAKATTAEVAADYNISKSTVNKWAKDAKKAKAQPKQLAAHQASAAARKAFNTPVVTEVKGNGRGVASTYYITFRGKIYR